MSIEDLIIPHKDLIKKFRKKLYADAFLTYEREQKELVLQLNAGALAAENPEAWMIQQALAVYQAVNNATVYNTNIPFKHKRMIAKDDYRLVLILYTLPMLKRAQTKTSLALAEMIVHVWNTHEDHDKLSIGDYEELVAGFKRPILSYLIGQ